MAIMHFNIIYSLHYIISFNDFNNFMDLMSKRAHFSQRRSPEYQLGNGLFKA
jgi:hypothetical protein